MANSNDKNRLNYGAPNYTPDKSGSGMSFGRVGTPVRDYSNPGRTVGTGVGLTFNTPVGGTPPKAVPAAKSNRFAKGGAIKKSGCEVKAYGDMIRAVGKKANGGKVQTSSDTARKLATEMGGMKKGGVQKKALGGVTQLSVKQPAAKPPVAVKPKQPATVKAIADALAGMREPPEIKVANPKRPKTPPMPPSLPVRPTPMPKPPVVVKPTPVKPPVVAKPMTDKDPGWDRYRKLLYQAKQLRMAKDTKDPRMMAKGGAGKVRKGMMSPEGSILKAVKPKKGLGGM
jgi:hypothetical protein